MTQPPWTLDELVARVSAALEDRPEAPTARIRAVPDARTVRWYVTKGLVDPPLATRGRQAQYGQRHLWQIVAVKRRQAAGVPLAAIQAELMGLPDEALAQVAGLEERFWSVLPAPAVPGPSAAGAQTASRAASKKPRGAPLTGPESVVEDSVELKNLRAVRLAPGVLLVLEDIPTARSDADIAVAARPLLDLLGQKGGTR